MFSDLVGSTALSGRMDPEDVREVISACQKCVAETVQRFGGFVAKYMGDGVLVHRLHPWLGTRHRSGSHSTTGRCARGMGLGIHATLKGYARARARAGLTLGRDPHPRWQQSHPGA
jgi:class 3 adenylate cyclase